MNALRRLLALSALAASVSAHAQTTLTNQPGACSTALSCSLSLTNGAGNLVFSAVLGPACSLGQSCSFPSGYVGTHFAYTLPDGSSADLADFAGAMTFTGTASCGTACAHYYYVLSGTFSGQDSLGRTVSGSTHQAITISATSRGGDSAMDTGGATTLEYSASSTPPPSTLVFLASAPPALTTGGSIGTVMVGVEDSSGNVVTGSTAAVTLSLAGPSGFQSETQSGTVSQGIVAFALPTALTIPGQYTSTGVSHSVTIDLTLTQ